MKEISSSSQDANNRENPGWSVQHYVLLIGCLDHEQEYFNLLLYWSISDTLVKYPNFSQFDHGIKIVERFLTIRRHIGEEFFDFVKNWEALVIGSIVKDPKNDLGFESIYNTSVQAMKDAYPHFEMEGTLKLIYIVGKIYIRLNGEYSLSICRYF